MVWPTKNTTATDLGKLLGIVWFDYFKGVKKEKRQQGIRELFKRESFIMPNSYTTLTPQNEYGITDSSSSSGIKTCF